MHEKGLYIPCHTVLVGKALPKVRNQMREVNRRGKYTAEPFVSHSFYTSSTVISGLKCSERKANCSNFHAPFGGIHADSQTPRLSFKVFYLRFFRNNCDVRLSFDTWSQYIESQVRKCIPTQLLIHPPGPSPVLTEQGRVCHTYLWMRLVRGSINFFPSLGSNGVRAPNYSKRRKVS